MCDVHRIKEQHDRRPIRVEQGGRCDAGRGEIEGFIHARFAAHYGADVRQFLPVLVSLRDSDGGIQAALGLRRAADGPLFLERYLAAPVERRLAAATRSPIDRDGIMEVGNLAVSSAGGGRYLITVLTSYLHASRHQWVVFTIGTALQNSFRRLGLPLLDLGPADPGCLDEQERSAWGSYYDQRPRVMAGRIAEGYEALLRVCQAESAMMSLWEQAARIARPAA